MVKGGVTHSGHDRNIVFILVKGLVKSAGQGYPGTHVEYGIYGFQVEAQGVASDIAGIDCFGQGLSYGKKGCSFRAA